MRTAPVRLAAFAVTLLLVFGLAAVAGVALGGGSDASAPGRDAAEPHAAHDAEPAGARAAAGDGMAGDGGTPVREPALAGLAVAASGYSLVVDGPVMPAGPRVPLRFRIVDAGGRTIREGFDVEHERRLHLIVIRRDAAAFQHVHPQMGRDGTWSAELALPAGGVYRAFADFSIDGGSHVLGTDLLVAGDFRPQAPPPVTTRALSGDLQIALEATGLRAGRTAELTFAFRREGRRFDALEPYLGARGHLVALREGDLAYLHVHPAGPGAGHPHGDRSASGASFTATFPTAGRYRLFLEYKTGGEVRMASFTIEVPA